MTRSLDKKKQQVGPQLEMVKKALIADPSCVRWPKNALTQSGSDTASISRFS